MYYIAAYYMLLIDKIFEQRLIISLIKKTFHELLDSYSRTPGGLE